MYSNSQTHSVRSVCGQSIDGCLEVLCISSQIEQMHYLEGWIKLAIK